MDLIRKMIGTCLTVTEFDASSFKVGVAPETLRKTNLGMYFVLAATPLSHNSILLCIALGMPNPFY